MQLLDDYLILAMWIAWGLYWILSARSVKIPVRRESTLSRWAHYGPLILSGWLLLDGGHSWLPLRAPFMARSDTSLWIAAGVTATGLMFTIWARRRLGRNWSGSVTIKADHELITTGPYRVTRHPIYTGLLVALAGSAMVAGEVRGLIAFGIAFAALWRKLKLEERFMHEQFGQAYIDYQRQVAAIVPILL
jgi:protein-S-isoprenylcysteine O-methyltransferase Ste14